uniref:Small ribosomal subunit protein uS17c n=2 Tax=Isochrysidaceae TaxID=418951 RepID=A0A3S6R3E0_9EUKA|nr:ribosomal protein S17 [Tisochrysis lutea]YP_009873637.1 ribosomal protein S17 [Isochrysis galbana]AUM82546.1 ribosomal protein S17 [Tisochrysis lutea]QKW88520.1 ribosomal protein S17 [Isochrysis galbana]
MVAKEKIGTVVSDQMLNTRIVAVSDRISHKQYRKVITRTKRYVAHDINCGAKIGDKVKIQETRPISKTKNWVLVSILEKSST